jgi:hypothetical protein
VCSSGNATIHLNLDNEPQPDALMIVEARLGGQATVDADGYINGGPELVAEVAASSVSIDLNTKLRVYRRNRVREYLVWRVLDDALDWFVLRQTQYDRSQPGIDGVLRSEVFPGLWLDPAALLRLNLAVALQVLQQGLSSVEHAAFGTRLRQAASQFGLPFRLEPAEDAVGDAGLNPFQPLVEAEQHVLGERPAGEPDPPQDAPEAVLGPSLELVVERVDEADDQIPPSAWSTSAAWSST